MPPDSGAASELFGLPLDEFTARRDSLVKQLRAEERREEAEAVGKLRKPTTDAWALNQVARRQSDLIDALVESHDALRQAGDVESMRSASESRQRALEAVLAAASVILEEAGHSSGGPVRDRMSRTLLAAATDATTEDSLVSGTLERTAEMAAQWPGSTFSTPSPRPSSPEPDPDREDRIRELEGQARDLRDQADAARKRAFEARQELEAARRAVEEADEAARLAERAAKEVEKELKTVQRR